ncbi:MAG: putative sulfate/molybdate transporter [Solirubrobacterales bacterium]
MAAGVAELPRGVALDRREVAGALADLGVLVPIAVVLIVSNGLSATAALLPAGLLYMCAALTYGLPIPVQPLKAFGAIAIAKGLGVDVIAAGGMLMGLVFLVLARSGALDVAARAFPRALVRGVQLAVGLLFLKIAWGLVADPPQAFATNALSPEIALPLTAFVLAAAIALRSRPVTIALVAAGIAIALAGAAPHLSAGPSAVSVPAMDAAAVWTALTLLVLPQIPLTFANSCLATADAARTYFGDRAAPVRPGRLATTLGSANVLAGTIGGMPVCHGAGGLTAHHAFGARTAGAPLLMGAGLLVLALVAGSGLAALLAAFPLPILAGMLAAAGVLHIRLLRDLRGRWELSVAVAVGVVGVTINLALGLLLGLAAWWGWVLAARLRPAGATG